MSMSRLLSHPAIVAALSGGAGFTAQLQKDREEEEKRRRELAMTTFERQMTLLDRDTLRQQQMADRDEARIYNEKQQAKDREYQAGITAENRYYAGLGSDNPALLEAAGDIAIEMGDADKLEAAHGRMMDVVKKEKDRLFDQAIDDGKSMEASAQVKYYGELAKQYAGTDYAAKAGLFEESAKAAKTAKDKEIKRFEEDDDSINRVMSYLANHPNASRADRLLWGQGQTKKLTEKGWDLLKEESAGEKQTRLEGEDRQKRAHQMAMGVVTSDLRQRAAGTGVEALLAQYAEGEGTIEGLAGAAGNFGVDPKEITALYYQTYGEFMKGPKSSAQRMVARGAAPDEATAQRMIEDEKKRKAGGDAPILAEKPASPPVPPPGISPAAASPRSQAGPPAGGGDRLPPGGVSAEPLVVGGRSPIGFVSPAESAAAAFERKQAGAAQQKNERNLGIVQEMSSRMGKGEDPAAVVQAMMLQYPDMTKEEILGLVAAPYRDKASGSMTLTLPATR